MKTSVEVKSKIQLDVWINVYKDAYVTHGSKDEANTAADSNRLACINVRREIEEGEGL